MIHTAVGTCQYQYIIVVDIFLLISQLQEFFVNLIQLILFQINPQDIQAVLQCSTPATGSQYDRVIIDTHIVRINNLIGLYILQDTVLMDTGRVCKSIPSDNRLIRLYRHIHQTGYHAACRINLLGIDICLNIDFVMTLDNHSDFFECSVTGTFTDTVNCNFHLTGTVQDTCYSVCSCHTQIVVAMSRDNCIINTVYMVNQVFNLGTIFRRQTVTGRIRNVHHRSTGFNNSFYHTCQIFIIRTACIFCIKFHIIHKTTRIFYSSYRTFDNFFTVRIEFVFDMRIRSSDTCMNPFVLSKLQCVYSYINIFLNSTGQGTNSRPGHRFRNLNHRIKITRT